MSWVFFSWPDLRRWKRCLPDSYREAQESSWEPEVWCGHTKVLHCGVSGKLLSGSFTFVVISQAPEVQECWRQEAASINYVEKEHFYLHFTVLTSVLWWQGSKDPDADPDPDPMSTQAACVASAGVVLAQRIKRFMLQSCQADTLQHSMKL